MTFLTVTLSLTACIAVNDFGAYWGKGTIDPALEGRWRMISVEAPSASQSGERYFRFKKMRGRYDLIAEQSDPGDAVHVKTLALGESRFLMLYEPKEDGAAPAESLSGDLWRYEVDGKRIEFLRLRHDGALAAQDISGGLVRAVKMGESWQISIHVLDVRAVAALQALADKPSLWEVWANGERVE